MKKNVKRKGHPGYRMIRKTWLIMKQIVFLSLVFIIQAHASIYSQNTRINLDLKNANILELIKEIERQTDMGFVYDVNEVNQTARVTTKVTDETIDNALSKVIGKFGLSYEIFEQTIILKPQAKNENESKATGKTQPKKITYSGKVIGDDGQPLPFASVVIKGTTIGDATNENGEFEIEVDPGNYESLVVSSLGYISQEVVIEDKTYFDVVLTLDIAGLEEVVVTGYQTLSRERSAGSFAQPNIKLVQERTTTGNVLQSLDGLVPGLTINNTTENRYNQILVRGLTTLGIVNANGYDGSGTNRNPLYVVDGIPVEDFSNIDAQDIESINVLKDATAASIWGAQAANGVIVISTKNAKKSKKLKIQYDAYVNFRGKPDFDAIPYMSTEEFLDYAEERFDPNNLSWSRAMRYTNSGTKPVPYHEYLMYQRYSTSVPSEYQISDEVYQSKMDSLRRLDNKQQVRDLMYRNASTMNHSLSVTGGGEVYSFYGSLGYTSMNDNSPGNKNETFRLNLRQNLKLHEKVNFYIISALTKSIRKTHKKQPYIDHTLLPYVMLQDANGNNLPHNEWFLHDFNPHIRSEVEELTGINMDYVPLNDYWNTYTDTKYFNARITAGLNVEILRGLKYQGTFGYNTTFSNDRLYDKGSFPLRQQMVYNTAFEDPDFPDNPTYYYPITGGELRLTDTKKDYWTIRNQFLFDKTIDKHQITVLAGFEASENKSISTFSKIPGWEDELQSFPLLDWDYLSTRVQQTKWGRFGSYSRIIEFPFSDTEVITRFRSYYANLAYTFDGKYSVNGSIRMDGSNLFGFDKAAQNKPVWSMGAKWIMSKENFLLDMDWLNRLVVRLTYGLTGNAPLPGTAASYDLISGGNSIWYPNGFLMQIATPANPKLSWERTTNLNFGIDFDLFNRLRGSLDMYSKKTSEMLGNLEVNQFTGYLSVLGNVGTMTNKGFELTLGYDILKTKDFFWSSQLIASYNKNEVVEFNLLGTTTSALTQVGRSYEEGYPAFAVFAFDYLGLDEEGKTKIKKEDGTETNSRGDAVPEDVIFMGTEQPKWNGGLSNVFRYKNFTLTANISFYLGHVFRANNSIDGMYDNMYQNYPAYQNNAWSEPGDELNTDIPGFITNRSASIYSRYITFFEYANTNVHDASYVKLRDLTLSYSLPKKLVTEVNLENVVFRATLSNVLLWKANKIGLDPEFGMGLPTGQNAITLGLNITL